jgi:hypothetical protein
MKLYVIPIKLTAFSEHSVHGRRIPLYRLLEDCWAPNWVLGKRKKFVKRDIWEKEETERLKLISEYVIARKRERSSSESSERSENSGIGTGGRKRAKFRDTFRGKSNA